MTLEEIKDAVEVIKAYRQMLTDSVSNQIDGDIKAFDVAVEAMERESCGDCVSRQAVFDALEKVAKLFPYKVPGNYDTYDRYNEAWNDAIGRAEMEIEGLPPVNPQKTGYWIDNNNGSISCSYCHTWFYRDDRYSYMHYCPKCGCRMYAPQERSGEV